ncbi:MAG: adenine deaminase [Sporocytophaga sp.]|uniref:adenine deaminase n=1 Tax=Sporocytophaga sp. TaxID=2231183 RepID=UPI001B2F3527|nr:adenine deaminase [Sporocytophaga sp.]MBO9702159.1 adenine deaminase [Sporocytophaga sp.]
MSSKTITGNIIDIEGRRIYKGIIRLSGGRIENIEESAEVSDNKYILPGFVDAHVHIESSMLVPSEFARLAVLHGTVATVSDPHEIANVCGMEGVEFMVNNGKQVPFKFNFGAPSCVPATTFETAGDEISAKDIETLLKKPEIKYLAEMMNWPGVLFNDPVVYEKINIAKRLGKVIDGHAPGLKGEQAKQYISAGISTDHECFTAEEALDKLKYGMKILIREGSAAKNFEALIDLLNEHEDSIMFCSDDKHPDNLVIGHINELVKRALNKGIDLYKVLKAACINPVKHYKLEVGLLKTGDPADFIIIDNLKDFNILKTFINGELVAENQKSFIKQVPVTPINRFNTSQKKVSDFKIASSTGKSRVIEALDGQLITRSIETELPLENGYLQSIPEKDILKITVVNRYKEAIPAKAFIKGFGLKQGALASSIAHDSHNIVAVGVNDEEITKAVNEVINNQGGISAVYDGKLYSLPLPVGGLMSAEDGYVVADKYTELDKISKAMGSTLTSPYMTLSFMALLVIPSLKLSDLGLFDGDKFEFVR